MKKQLRGLKLVALLLLISQGIFAQDMSIGAALKGSTMGYGADVVFQFHERMTARLGYDQLALGPFDFTFDESGIKYGASATVKTGSVTALYDFYIAKIFFVTAGVGLNNFNAHAVGEADSGLPWGDIVVPAEKIGNFDILVEPGLKLSPYLGLGLGRTLGTNLVGFAFELGSYYMGGPDLTIQSSGLIAPTSNPAFGQEELFESQLSQYYLYPVVKFSLSFNIASF